MKIVKIEMELVIDDSVDILKDSSTNGDYYCKDTIANYLNSKLYNDPEFFGDFGPENIVSIGEFE